MVVPMQPILDELSELRREIELLQRERLEKKDSKIYIENLDQIKLYLREELSIFSKQLREILKQIAR